MAGKRRKVNYSEMTYEDVTCPICLSIMIEPVTLPCSHSLCMPCFSLHVRKTSLACPLCRRRISVWVRRNSKLEELVNVKLWRAIKEKFPSKVEARLQGIDDSDEEDHGHVRPPVVCEPGELRQEYEALVEQEQKEMAARRNMEDELSRRLVQQLQEEENINLRQRKEEEDHLCKEDKNLALEIERADLLLQEQLIQLEMICGSDEEVARKIEQEERMKPKLSSKVCGPPTKGPLDVYFLNSLPSSSKTSSVLNISHSDTSVANYKFRLQLKDITSSQSSESDSDDITVVPKKRFSGKENNSKNAFQCESGKRSITHTPGKSRSKSENDVLPKKRYKCQNERPRSLSIDAAGMRRYARKDVIFVSDSDETNSGAESKLDHKTQHTSDKRGKVSFKRKFADIEGEKNESTLETLERADDSETDVEEEDVSNKNSSVDYSLVFSNETFDTESYQELRQEQLKIEKQLQQEEADRLFAERLQRALNQEMRL